MIIEENGNYLAHYKHKGSKNGIRRYQSYMVAPTRSGMVGQELGDAAKQRERIMSERERKKALRRGDLDAMNKKRWAKKYKTLYKHYDKYTNQELLDALERLDIKEKIHRRSLESLESTSKRGSNTLRNVAAGAAGLGGIYNAIALASNAYNTYNPQANYKEMPVVDWSSVLGKGKGKDRDKDDDGDNYKKKNNRRN